MIKITKEQVDLVRALSKMWLMGIGAILAAFTILVLIAFIASTAYGPYVFLFVIVSLVAVGIGMFIDEVFF